jgi:hypothetical protein
MLLTSYDRMLRYLAGTQGDALTDNYKARRELLPLIQSASTQVESYIDRAMHIESRTEYFDVRANQLIYYPLAIPVVSITSIYEDAYGQFTGAESAMADYFIGVNGDTINLDAYSYLRYEARRALRIIYTGGLAYDGVVSVYTVSSPAGTPTVGNFVIGATSGACGKVTAWDAVNSRLSISILYGTYTIGETLTCYTGEDSTGATGASAVLASKYQTALCETYPDLTIAAQMIAAYDYRHRTNYELNGTQKDGTSSRATALGRDQLFPEARAILDGYRRYSL